VTEGAGAGNRPDPGRRGGSRPRTPAAGATPPGQGSRRPRPPRDAAPGGDGAEASPAADAVTPDEPSQAAPADAPGDDEPGRGVAVDPTDAEAEVDADLEAAAEALEVDLELLLSERAQYLDAYQRAQADFENYRRQAQRRQEEAVVRSLGTFVERLLPVLDSCDAALSHGANEVEPVLTALYGALKKEGLERIDPKGAPFDPTEAEAVVHEPGEGGEQVVAEVLRPGYRWRGQVLRPAMVKVTD
jgi:molecular chaperone GrpE